MGKPELRLSSSEEALREIDRIERAGRVTVDGGWTAYQVLVHCAQSVEYSLSGYPLHRSGLFKGTVGRIALRAFLRRGTMSHDLAAAIPGASAIADGTKEDGCARLRAALAAFENHTGEVAPHFAYGPVTKAEYEALHAMHLANHLSAFRIEA